MKDLYPITVIEDRYSGTYSGGNWVAFNLEPWDVPEAALGDDVSCFNYFERSGDIFGVGSTLEEAVRKLYQIVREKADISEDIQHVGYSKEACGYEK